MPCTITGSLDGDRVMFAHENLKKAQERNTLLTQMLCEVMQLLEAQGIRASEQTEGWWAEHKKQDGR